MNSISLTQAPYHPGIFWSSLELARLNIPALALKPKFQT